MERRRVVTAAGLLLLVVSGAVAARSAWALHRARDETPAALAGRLGGNIRTFDSRYSRVSGENAAPTADRLYRVTYQVAEGRAIAEVQTDGRVRQLTLSRVRVAQDTWEPEPGDWTVAEAQKIARRWLPGDATLGSSGTFAFQEREAGLRETYASETLAESFRGGSPSGATGDQQRSFADGTCIVSYYQTRTGDVAFLLIGPA